MLQVSDEELAKFKSQDTHHASVLHIILRESEDKKTEKLLQFVNNIPYLEEISTMECADGLKAGKCYPDQALRTLCAAAQSDRYLNIAKSLLLAETDINGMQDGMTPLMQAAMHGSIEILKMLLHQKASVDCENSQQETSLLLACRSRQWQAAKVLFYSGANGLHADIDGQTPLHVAVVSGGVELVEHMVSRKEKVVLNKLKEICSLSDACQFNYGMLIELYPDLSNGQINEVVSQACRLRNTDVLEFTGITLANDVLATHITQAYYAGHLNCLNTLLKCTEGRKELPCLNITVSESCKHKEFISLTIFLVNKLKRDFNEDNGEPLRTAARSGNFSAIEYLIQKCHAKVDKPDTHGATALLFACMESHSDIVDLLLNWGANVNVLAEETPLTAACRHGQQKIVNRLLKENPISTILSKTNKYGQSPVDIAINNGHTALAANLMKKGAQLSPKNVSFHSLCQLGDTEQMSAFLQACMDHQVADEKSLSVVGQADNSKLLDLLLTNDTVIKSRETLVKALETASIMGSKMIVSKLIEWDNGNVWKSIKNKPTNPIFQAIKHHHPDIVELLLERGCSLTTDSWPLQDIVRSNSILTLVLEHLPQPVLNEALLVGCSLGHQVPEFCVRLLLNKSADVNYRNPQTQLTPLLAATTIPCETLVRTLLEYGADPNDIDDQKNCPLYLACDAGYHSIVSLLLYNGNDESKDCKYKHGSGDPSPSHLPPEKYPLWISCLHGYLDLVTLLAENKANLNLQNEKESLLEASHKAGQHEVVRLLLQYEADPAALSSIDLKTACHYGYAERAVYVAIAHEATMDELCACISEAFNEGFPETGMGIIINTPDKDKQKELSQVLQRWSDTRLQSPSTNDNEDRQSKEENPLWQCLYNRNTEQMIKLIKKGWNPNITNIDGITLLQACLSEKNIPIVHALCSLRDVDQKVLIDFNQKDSLGRNILFYVLKYLKGRFEQTDLFHLLVKKGADMQAVDDFGRTLLHEWNPQSATASTLDTSFESLKHIPNILDKCDSKGQTSLHAAVLQRNRLKVRQLLEAGSSPTHPDTNKISPLKLAARNPDIYQVFMSFQPDLRRVETLIPSSDDVQRASFSNEYTAAHRIPAALNKLFHKTNAQSSLHLFRETFETSVLISEESSFTEEFKNFCRIVPEFIRDLSNEIEKEDPLFAFKSTLSGSCCEGTKVIAMDEADVLCLFSHPDWQEFSILNHEEGSYTFIQLASNKFAEKYPKLVRKSYLSVHSVFGQFYGLIRKFLAKVLRKYKNLYIREPDSILESTYAISSLKLSWSSKVIQWQEFSLDVVPAILLTKEKIPKELNHYDLLHDIFVVPKWTASLIDAPYVDEAFRLGFSFPEEDLIHAMPDSLRQGYKLTKAVVRNCMVIDDRPIDLYISSYLLKCKMFECFAEMPDFAEKMKTRTKQDLNDDNLQAPRKILAYADQILQKLEESIKNQYQESFFLKGCNLLSHYIYREDFRPLLYMRLCRAMLQSPSDNIDPWKSLAQVVAEQLVKEEHFQRVAFVEEISTLKTMGLDANWRSENGTCLLYHMIKYGLVHGVHMLTEWGAALEDIDGDGRSAFQVAKDFKQPEVQKLLQKKGNYIRGIDKLNIVMSFTLSFTSFSVKTI